MEITLPKGLEFPSYVDDLKEILLTVEPRMTLIPEMRGHISRFVDGADMDLVYPHIFLGDCDAATNKQYLLKSGVTHVLNAAANVKTGPAPVKTGEEFYKDTPLTYRGLDLIDLPFANVSKHFEEAAEFIESALSSDGTVLVHCRQGRSRSASVLIAFLMTRRRYTAARALKQLKQIRDVRPNNGFLTQIAALDLKLFRVRLEMIRMEPSSESSSESSSNSGAENEENTISPTDPEDVKQRSSSIESDDTSASSKKKEDSKSSDYESVEYHSAVESVCSSTFSTTSSRNENITSHRSVSVSVQISLAPRRRRQSTDSQNGSQYVSRCVRIQNSSDESDNDADDESSDNES